MIYNKKYGKLTLEVIDVKVVSAPEKLGYGHLLNKVIEVVNEAGVPFWYYMPENKLIDKSDTVII